MKLDSSKDMYIGLGAGFVLVLIAAGVIGVPLRDLVIWALVFAALEFFLIFVLSRLHKR